MQELFSIEEIRIYLQSCDSFGDALHYLSPSNIVVANEEAKEKELNDEEDIED